MIPTADGTVIAAPMPCSALKVASWMNEVPKPVAIVQRDSQSSPAQKTCFLPYLQGS